MSALEYPHWRDWPVPALAPERYGHFVLFRPDPVASVANLEDAEASRAAALLPDDAYFLGIVMATAADRYWPDGRPELNFRIYLVGQGPSDPPSVCVPIAPALQLSAGRPPIELPDAQVLPWPDLYVRSYDTITAAITRVHDGPTCFASSLSQAQRDVLQRLVSPDYYGRPALPNESQAHPKQASGRAESQSGSCASERSTELDSAEGRSIYDKADGFFLHGELYVGLSQSALAGRLPEDPAKCSELVARLERIRDEWCDRRIEAAKAKRPQMTSDWLRGVQAASVGDPDEQQLKDEGSIVPTGDPSRKESNGDDGEGILPEDAVDERVERDALEEELRLKERVASALRAQRKNAEEIVILTPVRFGDLTRSRRPRSPAPLGLGLGGDRGQGETATPEAAAVGAAAAPPDHSSPPEHVVTAPSNAKQPESDGSRRTAPGGNRLSAVARAGIASLRSAFVRLTRKRALPRGNE